VLIGINAAGTDRVPETDPEDDPEDEDTGC